MSDFVKTMNWGFIGCGSVTEVKSGPAYQQTKGFNVYGVMRRNTEKLNDYAKRHNIQHIYTDADALINDPNIDAIYVATPPDSHKHYALKIAKVGKPCCIEKPLSPSYKDSLEIYKAFNKKNTPLFVAYYRRSLPRFLKVKEWLDLGYIGKVRHISAHLSKPASEKDLSRINHWRTDSNIAPAGYFDDLASHGLDLFTFLLGDVKTAQGISTNQQGLYSASDAVVANWIHTNGITGTGTWNFGCDTHLDQVSIYGNSGTIDFSVFHEKPICLKSNANNEKVFIENPKHIQQFHVENMLNHLKNDNYYHPATGKTALHTSWVMSEILGN
ncbi:Gfo/Idh/MocA family protein [Algibacter mikhailovii]|uniref:Oxidoreductase n=1 Tax=Algibacter mikhailovii TaxID=425498 RepID=A0A918QU37_9FLAO|nr:Gfo/Idh/MocA family oxidoreductase [Algibacter mikhailovii]GGZ70530.1 oxidoreductase [Algibacter mikhailovii]